MNYNQTIDFLYSQLPMFERNGATAYKPGLRTSINLDNMAGNPHKAYKTIHVAGTNGKGSVSSLIAATLQYNGYKVGLYTSPHLVDFRERIVVNGKKISKDYVVDFIDRHISSNYQGHPTFFELTSTMAFEYFKAQKVDYAVIEVGLGGRLDSTNIITPMLSVITNISLDHTQFLGDTLVKIATEKAGIIKPGIPVVIGEAEGEVKDVFTSKAEAENAPISFAQDTEQITNYSHETGRLMLESSRHGSIECELCGNYQVRNAATALAALDNLQAAGVSISEDSIHKAFKTVNETTGLAGRWMTVREKPRVICDTGHNAGGWQYLSEQLSSLSSKRLHMVIGFVKDKDIKHILELMPRQAQYYFTQASIPRALDSHSLMNLGNSAGLHGECYPTVTAAYDNALSNANVDDTVFVGGSTYVVAEFLSRHGID